MKKILSFLLPALFLGGGIALALTSQDEAICTAEGHIGYSYSGTTAPPLPFNPEAPSLPPGLTNEGKFEVDFECDTEKSEVCHWVYVPAKDGKAAKWEACEGTYIELKQNN